MLDEDLKHRLAYSYNSMFVVRLDVIRFAAVQIPRCSVEERILVISAFRLRTGQGGSRRLAVDVVGREPDMYVQYQGRHVMEAKLGPGPVFPK